MLFQNQMGLNRTDAEEILAKVKDIRQFMQNEHFTSIIEYSYEFGQLYSSILYLVFWTNLI